MERNIIDILVGKKIEKIYMDEDSLTFVTDDGTFGFKVEGDCCSSSYFYDFYGVKNLLENGKVTEVKEVELHPTDIEKSGESTGESGVQKDKKNSDASIKVYGYQITTTSEKYGDVTSVFSFRNYNNGYYGGWMEEGTPNLNAPEITEDVICTD
jgi:hypothetical protein